MYKSTINEELNAVGFLLETSYKGYWTFIMLLLLKHFLLLFYFFLLSWLYGVKRDITIIHK